ncbi:MAG: efflux transporter outer membrane subunit [Verrucomicrobiota bacterium JB023]|nr:efflux transporter outer membrane subunit [Verrucomicrobiota bacterium JB023]
MKKHESMKTPLRLAGMGAVALFLVACGNAVAPGRDFGEAKEMAPGRWVATREARAGIDNQWVSRFGDGKMEEVVSIALSANPSLRSAEERVRQAVLTARATRSEAHPQLSGTLNGTRSKQVFTGLPIPNQSGILSSLSSSLGASLDVSWEPDIWGKVRSANEADLARVGAEQEAYRAARASLAAQVVKAWLALGEANEQLRLAYESLDILEKTEAAVMERFANALADDGGTASQLRLARTEVARQRAEIKRRQAEVESAKRQIELLAGRYPAGRTGGGDVYLPKLPAKPPVGLPSDLLLRRPDILEAERRYVAAVKDAEEADLARFPSFSLTSSAGTSSSELGDLVNSDFGVWSLAGNLTMPILNGGRLKANYEKARSESREQLADLQRTVLDAFGEVEEALVADHFFDERIAATREALREAEESDQAAAQDYADGVETVLTVLEARGSRTEIATQLVTLRRQRLENRVNLHLALGGDFKVRGK